MKTSSGPFWEIFKCSKKAYGKCLENFVNPWEKPMRNIRKVFGKVLYIVQAKLNLWKICKTTWKIFGKFMKIVLKLLDFTETL